MPDDRRDGCYPFGPIQTEIAIALVIAAAFSGAIAAVLLWITFKVVA